MTKLEDIEKEIKQRTEELKKIRTRRYELKEDEQKKQFKGKVEFPIKLEWIERAAVITHKKDKTDKPFTTISFHAAGWDTKNLKGITTNTSFGLISNLGNKYYEGKSQKLIKVKMIIDLVPEKH